MNIEKKWIALTLLILTPFARLSAQETAMEPSDHSWSPRVTGAPSLLITPDAGSAAMGESGLLSAHGAFALMHNMSLLPISGGQTWGVSLSFTPWMPDLTRDTNLSTVTGYYTFDGASDLRHSVALGMRYFNIGHTLAFPKSKRGVMETRPSELSVDLGYGLRVLPTLSVGIGLRYVASDYNISQNGVSSLAQTIMGDLSVTYRQSFSIKSLPTELTAALALRNVGGKMTHDGGLSYLYSPATLDLGVGARLRLTESDELFLQITGDKLMVPEYPTSAKSGSLDEARKAYYRYSIWQAMGQSWRDTDAWRDLAASVGMEYGYKGRLFARAGYRYVHPDAGLGAGLTLGGGFRYEMARLDLAYFVASDSKSPLNNTLRVTLSADF